MATPTKEPKLKYKLKKTYCPTDKRLVSVKQVNNSGQLTLVCSRCGMVLWRRDGTQWQVARERLTAKQKS